MAPRGLNVAEPALLSLLVERYEGTVNESGLFEGQGTAHYHGGHSYTGDFVAGRCAGAAGTGGRTRNDITPGDPPRRGYPPVTHRVQP